MIIKIRNKIAGGFPKERGDAMNRSTLKQYVKLVEFLGQVVGPTYEITLYDVQGGQCSLVAIVRGDFSGQDPNCAPAAAQQAMAGSAGGLDYRINYNGIAQDGRPLRSSTFYIRDRQGELTGMLCFNFDDSEFQAITNHLFQLIHPDAYMEDKIVIRSDILESAEDEPERFDGSVTSVADSVLEELLETGGVPADRLTQEEKISIVAQLDQRSVFRLKGAVAHVAAMLHSSPASIYRYLSKVRGYQS